MTDETQNQGFERFMKAIEKKPSQPMPAAIGSMVGSVQLNGGHMIVLGEVTAESLDRLLRRSPTKSDEP